MEPLFAVVLQEDGTALGIRFLNFADEEDFLCALEKMCTDMEIIKEARQEEGIIQRYEGPILRCLNIFQKEISICFCTQYFQIISFKPLLEALIENYKENPNIETIEKFFMQINSQELPLDSSTLSVSSKVKGASVTKPIKCFGQYVNVKFKVPYVLDQLGDFLIKPLIDIFDTGIITIFNVLFSEQRILFVSENMSCEEIYHYVHTAVMLLSPSVGIIQEQVFPYTTIASRFFRTPGYVAGLATKELTKNSEKWDLLCDLDDGKIIVDSYGDHFTDEDTISLDTQIYSKIINVIEFANFEDQILSLFYNYKQYIIDIGMETQIIPNLQHLVKLNRWRINLWKQSDKFDIYKSEREDNIRFEEVFTQVTKLKYSKSIKDEDITKTFEIISKYDYSDVDHLTTILTKNSCLNILCNYIFHDSEDIRGLAKNFMKKLKLYRSPKVNGIFKMGYSYA
eukprot:TRINITY_DN3235_c0_g1_i1.p1 TRINITY_DN3235_c0_g1~~TRINITY_DN3235_c0_g1_i1.p1  ORF type:complete len:454 (+),score=110.98 TRINITY_DN3235_c0_g1_i1:165-1526(+)